MDLSGYARSNVHLRFRLGTDSSVAATGWRVDDVQIGTHVSIANVATASATGAGDAKAAVTSRVVEPSPTRPVTDFDGDTDLAVFRPTTGRWYIDGHSGKYFGATGDRPLPLSHAIYNAYFWAVEYR